MGPESAIPRFAADRMVARLARWLRLLGADVLWEPTLGGAALLRRARAEGRIMLSRDKRLRTAPDVLFLEGNDFRSQLRQVMARFPFDPLEHAFSRCTVCNELLLKVDRSLVARRIPAFVYATQETLAECPGCGRVYWAASHLERALGELKSLGIVPAAH